MTALLRRIVQRLIRPLCRTGTLPLTLARDAESEAWLGYESADPRMQGIPGPGANLRGLVEHLVLVESGAQANGFLDGVERQQAIVGDAGDLQSKAIGAKVDSGDNRRIGKIGHDKT